MDMDRFKKLIKSRWYRLYWFTLLVLVLSMYTLGCGGGVIQRIDEQAKVPPPAPPNKGFLELPQGPKNTRIYLNDRYIGRYSDYPRTMILLPKGSHRIKLLAPNYAPFYMEVLISPQKPIRVKSALLSLSPSVSANTLSHPSP